MTPDSTWGGSGAPKQARLLFIPNASPQDHQDHHLPVYYRHPSFSRVHGDPTRSPVPSSAGGPLSPQALSHSSNSKMELVSHKKISFQLHPSLPLKQTLLEFSLFYWEAKG